MKWQDPPEPMGSGRKGKYKDVADALKARPNEWALVFEAATPTTASNIRRGILYAFQPPGSFEAVARSVTNGKADIYVRYVGDQS